MPEIKQIESSKYTPPFQLKEPIPFRPDDEGQEMQLVMVYSDIAYQQIEGFGGALTEAAAYNYLQMDDENKKRFLEACYSKEGLNYTLGRSHIGACDFSFGGYSYSDTEDPTLGNFTTERDEKYLLPLIHDVKAYRGKNINLFASTWSPPAWMKTNDILSGGGRLKKECYPLYAEYLVKFIQDYERRGIPVEYITIQNEPKAVQPWESCLYTAEEEQEFIRDHFSPALKKAGLKVKILIWDHNKERVFERARTILSDPEVNKEVYGIAFHWYSGDHFENLRLCRQFFPDKALFFTEGCVELHAETSMAAKANSGQTEVEAAKSPWEFGECYGHDMMGNFQNGMNAFIDWNLLLDSKGGPNHVGNFCGAPLIYDIEKKELSYQSSYTFIAHFSRYVEPGSKLIATSRFTDELEVAAFLTPSGKKVVVVLNQKDEEKRFILKDVLSNSLADITVAPKSINTLIY